MAVAWFTSSEKDGCELRSRHERIDHGNETRTFVGIYVGELNYSRVRRCRISFSAQHG